MISESTIKLDTQRQLLAFYFSKLYILDNLALKICISDQLV